MRSIGEGLKLWAAGLLCRSSCAGQGRAGLDGQGTFLRPAALAPGNGNRVDLSDSLGITVPGGLLPGVLVADQADFLAFGELSGLAAVLQLPGPVTEGQDGVPGRTRPAPRRGSRSCCGAW